MPWFHCHTRSKRRDANQSRSQTLLLIVSIARIWSTSRLARRLYEPGREDYLIKGQDPNLAFLIRSFYLFSLATSLTRFFGGSQSVPLHTTLVSRLCHELCNCNHRSYRGTNNGSQRAVWRRSSSLRSTTKEKTWRWLWSYRRQEESQLQQLQAREAASYERPYTTTCYLTQGTSRISGSSVTFKCLPWFQCLGEERCTCWWFST